MKPDSFILDRRLYDLFQQEHLRQFTTQELRDAYATHLTGMTFNSSDLRRYVYEQIRRMLRSGWVIQDEKRQKRGQIYHWHGIPANLQVELVDNGYESSAKPINKPLHKPLQSIDPEQSGPDVIEHLESILKEIRLDFLSSMGEAERYKQLLDEMPHLKDQVEGEYLEARDRSSRLLGHLRAVEKTLKTVTSAR
ncbi:hypothetical protein F6476_16815 [Pseudomonas umsongensis]|jgi:hypothetical protein|uniref:hypothetical protein n=1 Tax=Pseudomonas umsongensis TaxID=198618 RepID=UPI0004D546EB|nr:hypothetical protein [Pseudomonas umsongensis]KEX93820.1 hypothetical protein HA62_11150 [Pseudomonas putida]MDP9690477.1 hypothetical protein [Pseudomonas mohnii]QFG30712.1 hypothetical protein F6476_16815 [Pseudomonas umsongensis]